MRRKALRWALRLVGPALLALVVLRMPDRGAIFHTLRAAAFWPLAAAVALNVVNLQLKVSRWRVLLQTRGIEYSMRRAWGAYLSSAYVGMLTPGRVGDVLRVQYLRHDVGVGYAEGLASVVMDRLCDLYVLVAFVAIGVVRFSSVVVGELAFIAWAGVAATALGPLLLLVPGIAERVVRVLYTKFALHRDAAGFTEFLSALRANVGPSLFWTVPMTALAFLVNYAQGWLLGRALHLDISFFDMTCLMAIASLLGLLPVSVSGVGVREVFFALAFPAMGLTAESGVSLGLLVFAVLYFFLVVVGFISWQIAPPPAGPSETAAEVGIPRKPGANAAG